ncbi:MAG: PKD domain-containing protein, partial [Halobacteriales archaeon]|nr:PKD domain-containing protein [Halobacteriales archaeon]
YAWDVDGDGRTDETGRIINHTYGSPGSVTVSLTVTDDDGATNVSTKRVSIDQLVPPSANLAISPDVPSVNDTVRFDAEGSTDPDGPIVRYVWTFGDGTNLTTSDPVADHAYTRGGTYTATVTVVDEDDARDTARATIRVNRPPAVEITASPAEPRRGQPLTLDASGTRDPDGSITSYDWEFGDGTVVTDGPATVTHQYTAFGTYTVAVTAEDDDGARRTATVEVPVENRPPDAAFSFSPFRPKPGRGVQFDASATTDPDGQVTEYRWDFDGDGEIDATGGPKIVHTFADRGRVTVRLVAVDDAGATNVTSTRVTVGSTLPLLEFLILLVLGLWVILFLWLSGALPDRVTDIGFRGRAERLPDLDIDVGDGSTDGSAVPDEDLPEDPTEETQSREP